MVSKDKRKNGTGSIWPTMAEFVAARNNVSNFNFTLKFATSVAPCCEQE
jgi:hypothetical protein